MSFRHTRRGYHHGNLKDALILAALHLIAERGPAGFTFAEVARAAGVSAAAPYRHFRDRNALIAEVARLGFERSPMNSKRRGTRGGRNLSRRSRIAGARISRLRGASRPFIARCSIRDFRWFRRSGSGRRVGAGVRRVAARGGECRGHVPKAVRPPAMMMALHIWAFSHGVADLFVGRGDTVASARRCRPRIFSRRGC